MDGSDYDDTDSENGRPQDNGRRMIEFILWIFVKMYIYVPMYILNTCKWIIADSSPRITPYNVISMEVCDGVVCTNKGTTAHIVDLEELVDEYPKLPSGERFVLHRSPCMRLCGKGLNVRLRVIDKTNDVVSHALIVEHVNDVRSLYEYACVLAVVANREKTEALSAK